MSGDKHSTDTDMGIVTSALENGLNSCRSVVNNYRAMLEQGVNAARVAGDACSLENIDQTNDIACYDAGSNPGLDKSWI